MGLFGKLLKKDEKKDRGCCSFNLDEEIAKAERKEDKKSCCDFDLDAEIAKTREAESKKECCSK